MQVSEFWSVSSYCLVDSYQHFRYICHFCFYFTFPLIWAKRNSCLFLVENDMHNLHFSVRDHSCILYCIFIVICYILSLKLICFIRNTHSVFNSHKSFCSMQVVMGVAQLYHHLAPRSEVMVVAKALIRLLRSHREVQSVVLNCIASISTLRKVCICYIYLCCT